MEHNSYMFENKNIATVPGHWLLARLGKRVLRPGGLKLTQAMLNEAQLANKVVVELAPGIGRTAQEILARTPLSYTGIDANADSVKLVSALVKDKGTCKQGMAQDTKLPDNYADVVVCEAMLTMQTPENKRAILREIHRILKPGGTFVSHELGITPNTISTDDEADIQHDLSRAIRVNVKPITQREWGDYLQEAGFELTWSKTAPMALLNPRRNLADEGLCGVIKIIKNVLTIPGAKQRVLEMRSTFKRHADHMCGIAMVSHAK